MELSVVIPCLNEADTLATCIQKAQQAIRTAGIAGEVIVADNGSTDGSPEIARKMGARVVEVEEPGYGSALMAGVSAAQGIYIVMGDADDSYDFLEIPRFLERLQTGDELVIGCRLPAGGGKVLPGAMPVLHRWLGNPLLTLLTRLIFKAPVHDVYCGLRGFSKSLYDRILLRCTGMEFAVEMIVKSSLLGARIAEIPITLSPDGRKSHSGHLSTFSDGWRTLKFLMLYSPRWLYLVPGCLLILFGLLGYALALPGYAVLGATLDAHTLLFASLAIMLGYQALLFGVMAKIFGISEGLFPDDQRFTRLARCLTTERTLPAGGLVFLTGIALLGGAVYQWWQVDFGNLSYSRTMRWVIPGMTLAALGFQSMLAVLFIDILRLRRKRPGG